ncbi:inositol monophosphatase family protein [Wohlfahrtiimonas chitiniclastica]|uniref:Inositol-1-monophosphatase n=2 Tax=Wohlfahrtiimonas chitiniclastica TaxID=400946 RepID=L8Y1C0_9GAMM|nr:inositol monophosphatase family protein [Wohlfahrtiimonas chitiniclastica]ELV08770.1 Hypothetical protein F387_00162 [Wohlfahrtiimonas chitiniclastica SH04]KZS22433.1 hypothetical protein BMY_0253 [Wohlfahrtiimonas chitiniclastica]MBS7817866.1 inositol monophosphatase [Wohlfahrtiimonas chitiniclastica]MBS7819823.1 inositol monophosphatase [Wohlfahrtiimonas chitiniclastica]MBS7823870.1 inositol monophosphatase [Wohlfahrtiimonas chitiniclastica]
MNPQLTIAQKSVSKVSRLINQIFEQTAKLSQAQREETERFDIFYAQIETEIAKEILYAYPDHTVETKLTGVHGPAQNKSYWYVSGIVGKQNFLGGNADFAVSVAYMVEDKLMAAYVYAPVSQKTYMAVKNEGATLNDIRIRLPRHSGRISDALLLTDARSLRKENVMMTAHLHHLSLGVRVLGDEALSICEMIEGKASAAWLNAFDPCDHLAAVLIAQEGGALATDFSGNEVDISAENAAFATPKLLKPLLQSIHQAKR